MEAGEREVKEVAKEETEKYGARTGVVRLQGNQWEEGAVDQ